MPLAHFTNIGRGLDWGEPIYLHCPECMSVDFKRDDTGRISLDENQNYECSDCGSKNPRIFLVVGPKKPKPKKIIISEWDPYGEDSWE